MDREGIYAARSVIAIGADGENEAGGSNAQTPPPSPASLLDVQPDNDNSQSSADPGSINVKPARSPVPDSALPEQKPPQPAEQPAQTFVPKPEAAKRPDPKIQAARESAREDRINDADQAARDRGSIPQREEARRNRR
jgi:hypothetical protein